MSTKTVNGILFIIAAIAPLVFYFGLGTENGTGVLTDLETEKFVYWIMLSMPIALMLTLNSMKGGSGAGYAQVGLLIVVIAYAVGTVGDLVGAASESTAQLGDAVGQAGWGSMMLSLAITGVGYYVQKIFPTWLSGILIAISVYAFIVVGIIGTSLDPDSPLFMVAWLGFTVSLLLLGVFTLRKKD